MRCSPGIRLAAASVAALASVATLSAQEPPSLGTATSLGLGGLTEARFAESALWNPALPAIFDGPMNSISLLNVNLEPAGNPYTLIDTGRRLHRLRSGEGPVDLDGRLVQRFRARTGSDGISRLVAGGQVQWLGLHARDLVLSLTSQGLLSSTVPDRFLAGLTEPGSPGAEELRSLPEHGSRRYTSSTLAVAKGHDMGALPLLGRSWTGVGLKASRIHDHAHGRFGYAAASDGVEGDMPKYAEVGVRNTHAYGLDFGLVSHPAPPLLLSVAISNAYQRTARGMDDESAYRDVSALMPGPDGSAMVVRGRRGVDADDNDAAWIEDAESLARSNHFMPSLRLGGALETAAGRVLVGHTAPLERSESIDRAGSLRYSVGFQSNAPDRSRISFGRRFDGTRSIEVGTQRGFCEGRLAMGAGYHFGSGPRRMSMTFSWSRGQPPCGSLRP